MSRSRPSSSESRVRGSPSEQIVEYSRTNLAHYKVPSVVRFVESLPHGLDRKGAQAGGTRSG